MKKERKYLDEFEMGLLEKAGIKRLKKKYDANDLLAMLPKEWKEGTKEAKNENWCSIEIRWNHFWKRWYCTSPTWKWENCPDNEVSGETLVECLLCAVLKMARRGDRDMLSKTYLVENWKFKPEEND